MSTQVYMSILSPSFLPFFLLKGSKKHLGPREALEHRLLGPLNSELRSEVTSEATGSLRGHLQRNSHSSGRNSQLRIAPSFLLHSIVVKASDFGAREVPGSNPISGKVRYFYSTCILKSIILQDKF